MHYLSPLQYKYAIPNIKHKHYLIITSIVFKNIIKIKSVPKINIMNTYIKSIIIQIHIIL